MIKFGYVIKKTKEHNPNWLQISENPFRILIIVGPGSGKTILLLNLISQQFIKFIYMLEIHTK